jgi:hypothetical protein
MLHLGGAELVLKQRADELLCLDQLEPAPRLYGKPW